MAVARALKIGLPLTRRRVRPAVTWPVALLLLVACVFLTIGSLTSAIFAEQTVAGLAQGGVYASLAVALVLTIAGVFYLGLFPERVIRALGAQPTISILIR